MNILIVINDAPYGDDRPYNALRTAMTLQKNMIMSQLKYFYSQMLFFVLNLNKKPQMDNIILSV